MKKNLKTLILVSATAGLLLFAVACVPSPSATPAPGVTEPPCGSYDSVDYTPGSGTTIAWADMSSFVYIPSGGFQMGQDETQPSDHSPAHSVDLDGFWIQQREVTNAMYAACVELGICTPPFPETGKPYWYAIPAHAEAPVVGVDWYQAATYCEWIGGRLPSEAEWEEAARGTQGDPYPWGDEQPTCDLLNFDDCLEPVNPMPINVGSFLLGASLFRLDDTAGNASEWVFDWYAEDYYAVSSSENPTGPAEGELRVVRGSDYASDAEAVPLYLRSAVDPQEHPIEVGFRCALDGDAAGNPPPPACELPAYSLPVADALPPSGPDILAVTALGYCIPGQDNQSHGYVNLVFDEPVESDTYVITSSANISGITQDINQPETLVLVGMPLDQVFELTVCPQPAPQPMSPAEPVCADSYFLDPNTGKCRYQTLSLDQTCHEGQAWVEGYGYVDAATDPLMQMLLQFVCMLHPGYTMVELSDSPLTLACLPVDGTAESTTTECLPGLTYESDESCCVQPETLEPACLTGYVYDPTQMLCIPQDPTDQCTSFYIYVPSCEAPVIKRCQNPSQYGDKGACEAGNCRWEEPVTGGPAYCTYP
jgi:sulfatase modifying factor 1